MKINQRVKLIAISGILVFLSGFAIPANAATPIKSSNEIIKLLSSQLQKTHFTTEEEKFGFKELNRSLDNNQTLHIRLQQTYLNYPVFGGDFILHQPNSTNINTSINSLLTNNQLSANGKLYLMLKKELPMMPLSIADIEKQKILAIEKISSSEKILKSTLIDNPEVMIFVDSQLKAHFALVLSFIKEKNQLNYFVDLLTLQVLARQESHYVSRHTVKLPKKLMLNASAKALNQLEIVQGGGVGGNLKTGQLIYDGAEGHLPSFTVMRDPVTKTCYLKNKDVIIEQLTKETDPTNPNKYFTPNPSYPCDQPDKAHNNVYWNTINDVVEGNNLVNGGYSPNNDVMFAVPMVRKMYQDWYGLTVIVDQSGNPVTIHALTNTGWANAGWYGEYDPGYWLLETGRGDDNAYPFTSSGVLAHEVTHGVTHQFLGYVFFSDEMHAISESFSDMASQLFQYYLNKKNNWLHDSEIMKNDIAKRYFEDPTRDGHSIKHLNNYKKEIPEKFYIDLIVIDSTQPLDETKLREKVSERPLIIKQGNEFYFYGNPDGKITTEWKLVKLASSLYEQLALLPLPTTEYGVSYAPNQISPVIFEYINSKKLHTPKAEVMEPHFAAGLYNHLFYLISTSTGFDVKKAFTLMFEANQHYWTATADFTEATCGIMKATDALHYTPAEKTVVQHAIETIGINVTQC